MSVFRSLFRVALGCALVALIVGCGGPELMPVTGRVTSQGTPVYKANITFYPNEKARPAVGVTDEDGRFTLTTLESGDGALVGEHKVTISHLKGARMGGQGPNYAPGMKLEPADDPNWKPLVDKKYASKSSTPLVANVTSEGPNEFHLEVDPPAKK